MEKGLVSIITPMYKGAEFVGDTIESVLKQTYTNWEMIIVDDCSPDDGAGINVVKRYADPRIKLIESKINKGSSGARNIAFFF
jgi:teichuronic acid biosynthesis glycosyltransferase TuaG